MIELGLSKIQPERRESGGGDYTAAVIQALHSQAAGLVDVAGTAAVECAAGLVSRALCGGRSVGAGLGEAGHFLRRSWAASGASWSGRGNPWP